MFKNSRNIKYTYVLYMVLKAYRGDTHELLFNLICLELT